MRTNLFSKSAQKAAAASKASSAQGFSSQMGYPTNDAPVQLLKKGDFANLADLGFDVADWTDFEFQLITSRDDLDLLAETHRRLSAMVATDENRADIAKALGLVATAMRDAKRRLELRAEVKAKESESASTASRQVAPTMSLTAHPEWDPFAEEESLDKENESITAVSARTQQQAAPSMADYYGFTPSSRVEDAHDDSDEDALDLIARQDAKEREDAAADRAAKIKKFEAQRRVEAALAAWRFGDPFPAGAQARALRADYRLAGEAYPSNDPARVLMALFLFAPRPKNLAQVARIIFKAANAAALANTDLMETFDAAVQALSNTEFQVLMSELGGYSSDEVVTASAANQTISGRVQAHTSSVKLHVFLFPGASKGDVDKSVAAAQKWYATYRIGIDYKVTTVTEEAAKARFDNGAFFSRFSYSAKFVHSDDAKKADSPDVLRQHFAADAGCVPVYAFGKFENADPDGHALAVTFQLIQRQHDPNAIIVMGPDMSDPLTLAHELGHLLGGHHGGAHDASKGNLMYAKSGQEQKRITVIQQLFFKASPLATTKDN